MAVESPSSKVERLEVTCTGCIEAIPTSKTKEGQAIVHQVEASAQDHNVHLEKIRCLFDDPGVPMDFREKLWQLLARYDQAFSLEEGERGKTNLLEFHIDTGVTPPIRQRARQMPFAARAEVARQLKVMQVASRRHPDWCPQ